MNVEELNDIIDGLDPSDTVIVAEFDSVKSIVDRYDGVVSDKTVTALVNVAIWRAAAKLADHIAGSPRIDSVFDKDNYVHDAVRGAYEKTRMSRYEALRIGEGE